MAANEPTKITAAKNACAASPKTLTAPKGTLRKEEEVEENGRRFANTPAAAGPTKVEGVRPSRWASRI